MRRILWLIGIISLLQGVGVTECMSQGEAEPYPIIITGADQALQGMWPSYQSYINIPEYWTVNQTSIKLDYKASPLAAKEKSSVTLLMNGTPFYSFRPVMEGEQTSSLTVPVPGRLLAAGSNQLTIQGALRTNVTAESSCLHGEERDNWLQIAKTSVILIDYVEKPLGQGIREFYRRFAGQDAAALDRRVVVVPDDASPKELETAAHVIAGLARASETKDAPIPLVAYSDESWKKRNYVILVAQRDHLPVEVAAGLGMTEGSVDARVTRVDAGGTHFLVVTAEKPDMLPKAGRLLANADLALQLDGDSRIVTEELVVDMPADSVSRSIMLTERGDLITGSRHQTRSYFVSLPANRSIAEASKITLDFRYSRNLDFSRSLVTLLVDGKPIGSKRLNPDWADNDTLMVPIPRNANISGNFVVTTAFDLELEGDSCVSNGQEMPWAFVGADSELQLNTLDRTELVLDNYPYPFLRDGVFHKIAVVLPKEQNRYVLGSISNLFSLLGQYAESNTGELHFFDDQDDERAYRDSNIIVIGSSADNELVGGINSELYFSYGEDGRTFLSNEKKSIDPRYGGRLGIIQLLESPLAAGNGMLAVTGSTDEYAYLASKLMASEAERWKLAGDAVLTDADGIIQSYRFKLAEKEGVSRTIGDVVDREDVLQFLTAAALVLVLVLLSLLMIVRKYRRKRGGDRET
ncbi:cellulose biosynthesis cyclic di-GMP-binding regulatory protein BcsB [Paenibacillus sp. strain BS8-2]